MFFLTFYSILTSIKYISPYILLTENSDIWQFDLENIKVDFYIDFYLFYKKKKTIFLSTVE